MSLTITRKPIKSLRLKVSPDWVFVSAPKHLSDSYITKFIESKKEWIEKVQAKFQKAKERSSIELKENEILLHGQPYSFIYISSLKNKTDVDHENHTITSGINLQNAAKLKNRYKTYAKIYLIHRAKWLSQRHKLPYANTYIRDQKTKWWTCSSKKNIGLNRKLVKMPEEITEYVICHELAHLKEMNHSKRFRAVVEELYPNYKDAIAWMKKYGMSLQ